MSRRPSRRLPRLALVLVLGAGSAGCYTYAPAEFATLAPGQDVRARLDAGAALRLEAPLGRDARILEGEVVRVDDGQLLLAVPSTTVQTGFTFRQMTQEVAVGDSETLSLEIRRLDRPRTVGMAALGGLVLAVLVREAFGDDAGGDTDRPPTGGPSELRWAVPLPPLGGGR